jgi:hypothetical protein
MSDETSKFLPPRWLKEWLPIVTGFISVCTVVMLLWKGSAGEVSVNLRLVLLVMAGMILSLLGLVWFALKRQRMIKQLRAELEKSESLRKGMVHRSRPEVRVGSAGYT